MSKETKSNIIDVIKGINQAMAISHDGAYNKDFEPVKIGLKREKGIPLLDKRVMDGFGVKFQGRYLIINYQSEIKLRDVYETNKFESNIEDMIGQIINFLKKEYKAITGKSLSLKKLGEPEVLVQSTSLVRAWVEAHCIYEIENINLEEYESSKEKKLKQKIKDFLSLKSDKKPSNVTVKYEK